MRRGLSEEGYERLFVKMVRWAIKKDRDFILETGNLEKLSYCLGITDGCCATIRDRVRRKIYD